MKKFHLLLLLLILSNISIAQSMRDFKTKSSTNSVERTQMLDLMRERVYDHVKQDVIFVVNHFKVINNYAYFEGTAQRKDGRSLEQSIDEDNDCCNCGALFKKTNGKWHVLESGYFPTDVWCAGLTDRYPNVPRAILTEAAKY
jgi:hypothetical protein